MGVGSYRRRCRCRCRQPGMHDHHIIKGSSAKNPGTNLAVRAIRSGSYTAAALGAQQAGSNRVLRTSGPGWPDVAAGRGHGNLAPGVFDCKRDSSPLSHGDGQAVYDCCRDCTRPPWSTQLSPHSGCSSHRRGAPKARYWPSPWLSRTGRSIGVIEQHRIVTVLPSHALKILAQQSWGEPCASSLICWRPFIAAETLCRAGWRLIAYLAHYQTVAG